MRIYDFEDMRKEYKIHLKIIKLEKNQKHEQMIRKSKMQVIVK